MSDVGLRDDLRARWRALVEQATGRPADDAARRRGETLIRAWGRWPRRYHGPRHLLACLRATQALTGAECDDPRAIAFALWYHDAVYWPWSRRNEARSARWAHRDALALGLGEAFAQRVHALVMATAHGQGAAPEGDARWVVDIDLGVLGQPPETYDRYAADVRREFFWVRPATWRRGRSAVLRHFLALPYIYSTDTFRARWEAQARQNLARELAQLGG